MVENLELGTATGYSAIYLANDYFEAEE